MQVTPNSKLNTIPDKIEWDRDKMWFGIQALDDHLIDLEVRVKAIQETIDFPIQRIADAIKNLRTVLDPYVQLVESFEGIILDEPRVKGKIRDNSIEARTEKVIDQAHYYMVCAQAMLEEDDDVRSLDKIYELRRDLSELIQTVDLMKPERPKM